MESLEGDGDEVDAAAWALVGYKKHGMVSTDWVHTDLGLSRQKGVMNGCIALHNWRFFAKRNNQRRPLRVPIDECIYPGSIRPGNENHCLTVTCSRPWPGSDPRRCRVVLPYSAGDQPIGGVQRTRLVAAKNSISHCHPRRSAAGHLRLQGVVIDSSK